MNVKELLGNGRLSEAIDELNTRLRNHPSDTQSRSLLFELLCFAGRHERAAKQLDILASQTEMKAALTAQVYAGLLEAERNRQAVFQGGGLPKFLVEPPSHIEKYLVLLKRIGEEGLQVGDLLEEAEDSFPLLGGRIGERRFSGFRDADDRLAPVLEAFLGSEYLWIPFEQIQKLEIDPPKTLLDLYWIHARVQIVGAAMQDVFAPVLYVDSHRHLDDSVKLGRTTEWNAFQDRLVIGTGLRLLLVDDREVPFPELGRVSFDCDRASEVRR